MQRGIATILTAVFTWLLVLPLLAPSAELNVPACCRKNGKHHCMMMPMEQTDTSGAGFTAVTQKRKGHAQPEARFARVTQKCPCCPRATMAAKTNFGTPAKSNAVFAGLLQHPAVSPQTEASYRISHDRSRQKRGPPSLILS